MIVARWIVAVAALGAFVAPVVAEAQHTLVVSTDNIRTNPVSLEGATLSGVRYIFVTPEAGARQVRFWLNNPAATGSPRQTDKNPPWDFAGGNTSTANPFDTRALANGTHSITAVVTLSTGSTVTTTSQFTVSNEIASPPPPPPPPPPTDTYSLTVSSASTRTSPVPLAGATLSGDRYIFVTPETGLSQVKFWLDNPAATGTPFRTENNAPWDFAGGTATNALPFDTTKIADGGHTVTAMIKLSTGSTVTMTSNFTVLNAPPPPPPSDPPPPPPPSDPPPPPPTATPTANIVSISGTNFHLNGLVTYPGAIAQGKLMNVRMVNSTFEDTSGLQPTFDPEANTDEFIAAMPSYVGAGVRAFTLNLQGGNPGYSGAVNTAFNADGSLKPTYLARVERVIREADRLGAVIILGLFYFRQDEILSDEAAVKAGVVNVMTWLQSRGLRNVLVEIANEHGNSLYNHPIIQNDWGMWSLIKLAKATAPEFLVSASSWGISVLGPATIEASDYLLVHGNAHTIDQQVSELTALQAHGKPIVMNEDFKTDAAIPTVQAGASWGFYYLTLNQHFPFTFGGTADQPQVYEDIRSLTVVPQ